jgi:hypothetical protein
MTRKTTLMLGLVATTGALLAVIADWYSVWTGRYEMDTAFAVGLAGVLEIMANKAPADMEVGSFLGQYFIPLHAAGLYLAYLATRPASRSLSVAVLAAGLYTVVIGTSLHASLVYVGIVARSGDPTDIQAMTRFFDFTGYSMVALILVISVGLSVLILSGRSLYPRCAFFGSPMGLMLISTALFYVLPDSARDVREFLTIAGFNFPLMIFHAVTTGVLLSAPSESSPISELREVPA